MEGPSPGIHNLLFEEVTANHPARVTFTYYEGNAAREMTISPEMVRTCKVLVQETAEEEETFFVNCNTTTLYLEESNLTLFRQWAQRQGIFLGSQPTKK